MKRQTRVGISEETNGKTDRRRVLQALGVSGAATLAAGAVPFATAAAQPAPAARSAAPGMSFPVLNVQHLSLQVADYVRSRDFYINVFGLRDAWDNGRQCALEFGSPALPNGIYIRPFGEGGAPGVGHIAFGVPNVTVHLQAMREEMERRQLANIQADGELGWSADDPNGYELNIFVPAEPSHAMFPGAGRPCADAESQACHEAYEAGLGDALEAAPKADGSAFEAYAFSYVVLHCADLLQGREFYENMMGMKVIQEHADQVLLRFGAETLALRPAGAGGEAYVNHYGFAIAHYDHAAVKAELDRLGLDPAPHTDRSWTVRDPDGMRIEVAGWGLPEYLASIGVLL